MAARVQRVPKTAGNSFQYFDRLLRTLEQLINDTTWPDPDQAELVRHLIDDVYELSAAMRTDAEAGRWTTGVLLMRPLQERSQYALAVAIKPAFGEAILQYLREEFAKKSKSRRLVERARGIIACWEKEALGQPGFLQEVIDIYGWASDLQHHALGFSQMAKESCEARRAILSILCHCVKEALGWVVLAIKVREAHDTVTWRRARSTVAQTY